MKKGIILFILVSLAISTSARPHPQQPSGGGYEEFAEDSVDIDARNTRENPVFDYDDDDIDIPVPSFINTSANRIILNGADWGALRRAIAMSDRHPVSIVNIGDSHIQADIGTGTVRELLQYDYGNAGRGIISPLKMSGTNEPQDYVFTSPNGWTADKLMSARWPHVMGFTGAAIRLTHENGQLTIGTSERDDYNPFWSVTIFHNGKMNVDRVTDASGRDVHFRAIPSRDYTQLLFASAETRVTVHFTTSGDIVVFGASLSGERPGVFYHAIGNNGATYATYNKIGNVGSGIAPLKPSLVIISLGTNEAFGHLDTDGFYRNIDRLVRNIRHANPGVQILLTTPMECDRSVYTSVKKKVKVPVRSRRGRRGRRSSRTVTKTVTRRVRSYAVNSNIAPLREAILRYGRDNGVAVYDFYDVAGGKGAASRWISAGLFSRDRVHHSYKGYHLQGRLLYEALVGEFRDMRQ